MSATERKYMQSKKRPEVSFDFFSNEGVLASCKDEAQTMLRFASPTLASDGKWYRTTVAVTNVPVSELYGALSRCNMIVQRLREIAEGCGDKKEEIVSICNQLQDLNQINGGQGYGNHSSNPRGN